MCKHVVAKNDIIQSNGDMTDGGGGMPDMPNLNMGELAAMAANGHQGLGGMMQAMGAAMDESKSNDDTVTASTGKEISVGGLRSFMGAMQAKQAHYTGVPIRVDGQIVATFCVIDRQRHREDIDVEKVKALAARATAIFVKRAAAKKKAKGKIAGGSAALEDGSGAQKSVAPRASSSGSTAAAAAAAAAGRGEVVELNSANFADVALDPNVDVAVLLITPWCPHCGETKQAWAAAALDHAAAKASAAAAKPGASGGVAMIFATFDVQSDDPPCVDYPAHAARWQTGQVPALVLAPRGEGAAPLPYGALAAAQVPAALRWISSQGVPLEGPWMTSDSASSLNASSGTAAGTIVPAADALRDLQIVPRDSVSSGAAAKMMNAADNNNRSITAITTTTAAGGGGGGAGFDADLFQLALSGLRQAETSGVQVVASWASTAD